MTAKCIVAQILIVAFICGFVAGIRADDRVIEPDRGFQPAHAYAISGIESIDKATGSLSLHIPLAQLPEGPAGFTAGLTLIYNNKYWEVEPMSGTFALRESSTGGWRLTMMPSLAVEYIASSGEKDPCGYYLTSELFQMRLTNPDGGRSTLLLSKPVRTMPKACEAGTYRMSQLKNENASSVWYTADGSFLRLEIDAPSISGVWPYNSSWTLYRQDGSSVRYEAASRIFSLRDRNGNRISITKTVDPMIPGHTYEVMADEFGRTVRLDHFAYSRDEVTQTGHDGTSLVWKVYYGSAGPVVPGSYICDSQVLMGCGFDLPPLMVTRLELPNGLSYTFGYERTPPFASNYRELRTLTLPTGAKIEYGYRLDSVSTPSNYFHVLANPLTSKTVSANGETVEKWEFSYDVNAATGSYSRNTHKAPDGGITSHEFKTVSYKLGLQPDSGLITRVVNPDGSILNRDWQSNFPREKPLSLLSANPWVRYEYTTTANASGNPVATSVKVFTMDKNGNTTSVEERGWLPYSATVPDPSAAALIRKTVNTYLNGAVDSTSLSIDEKAYSYASLPQQAIPRNLISSAEIRDGMGNVKSRSQFHYAETNPARTVGNLTQEYRWDSTFPGSSSIGQGTELTAGNAVVKKFEYTIRGNLKKETDARNASTTYDYGTIAGCPAGGSSNFADLYRTGAHRGQDGFPAMLDWAYSYNCNSGKITASTDSNSLVTSYSYDRYGRPTVITDGNYRKTVHTYSDNMLWIVTQKDVEAFNDLRNVSVLHYDALGRVRLARQLEEAVVDPFIAAADESVGIRTETKYVYGLSRNETWVSNPYRMHEVNASTRGWTVKRLDKAGRVCVEEWFSGAALPSVADKCVVSSGATGVVVHRYDSFSDSTLEEIVDDSGRTRQMYRDVLGRLLTVREDPASAKHDTYYQYDLLDNLTGVRQAGPCGSWNPVASPCGGGQMRAFSYDSLGRLSSAATPEMGGNSVSYGYDGNGNVISKFSSGNPALLVRYTYDLLNRIKTRDYSDGTPRVTFCYDGSTWNGSFGGCNGFPEMPSRGHLTEIGSETSRTSYAYNSSGQVVASTQTTAGKSFAFEYAYNAAFALASETYPGGRKVFAEFDDAGRSKRLWGQSGAETKAYAGNSYDGIRYAAHGAVSSATLGNGMAETRTYNGRLQLTRIQAGDLLTLSNCYHAGDDAICPSLISLPGNSEDVQGQRIQRGGQIWTQRFTYDALNRLNSVSEAGVWQQNYGFDPHGNRWISNSSGLSVHALSPMSANAFVPATNRLSGTDNYDARGNLKTYGAFSLIYDGENRIVSAGGTVPSARYEYDGDGRRVRTHVCQGAPECAAGPGATTTIYVYDAFGKLSAEYGPNSGSTGTSYFTLDHLGSTRLETDGNGRQVRCSDYLPFGQEIPAGVGGRSSCFESGDNKIRFTGKQRDTETGLDFSIARYYSGLQGRFTSDDPLNIPALKRLDPEKFFGVIANPQNWNGYVYALNNPLKNVDPDGYLTIIVAGTWNKQKEWQNSPFKAQVEKTFGESATLLPNDHMGVSVQARTGAAKKLNEIIAAHKFAPGEKLNVVALSHGGNVVAEATMKGMSHKIDTLVTMGTPIRPDYQFNQSKIGEHLNVYSRKDAVQPSGGMTYDFPGSIIPGFIPASRKVNLPNARNLDATSEAGGHTELWTKPGAWNKIVAPEIKK